MKRGRLQVCVLVAMAVVPAMSPVNPVIPAAFTSPGKFWRPQRDGERTRVRLGLGTGSSRNRPVGCGSCHTPVLPALYTKCPMVGKGASRDNLIQVTVTGRRSPWIQVRAPPTVTTTRWSG